MEDITNNLITTQFGFQKIRYFIDQNNDPWFVCKDLCKTLSLQTDATMRLDSDEKGLREIQTLGGRQKMVVDY